MPPNNSATSGTLLPGPGKFSYDFVLASDPRYWYNSEPLEGQPLENFFQQLVSGITGLPPQLVRPAWQPEAPVLPPWHTTWLAVSLVDSDLDRGWAWEDFDLLPGRVPLDAEGNPLGLFLQQHETFDLVCTSYGERANWTDSLLRDGFQNSQNASLLVLTGLALVRVNRGIFAPELINQRRWRRVDRRFTMHRSIRRLYPILQVLSSQGQIEVS